jgi:ubiquinone/menaquinone biosynthesis C-methylase UbiE
VSFDVPADAYQRFMGRYSRPLAERFLDMVEVRSGERVIDVGCGPGVLTGPLVERCGVDGVAAVDPSASFVEAVRARYPELDVREASAEDLPYDDDTFDAAFAQLVVQFMSDPVTGLREMGRVTRPGGLVVASVWDHASKRGPLSPIWAAASELDASVRGESDQNGVREGHLAELAEQAGLRDVRSTSLSVRVRFASFDEWWAPYLLGVGPIGAYVASLDAEARERLSQRCRDSLPPAPFEQEATAWLVLARAAEAA